MKILKCILMLNAIFMVSAVSVEAKYDILPSQPGYDADKCYEDCMDEKLSLNFSDTAIAAADLICSSSNRCPVKEELELIKLDTEQADAESEYNQASDEEEEYEWYEDEDDWDDEDEDEDEDSASKDSAESTGETSEDSE